MTADQEYKTHHGKNVKFFRDLKGMKQEELAKELKIPQSKLSELESRQELNEEVIEKIAKALKIPPEYITADDKRILIYAQTFNDHAAYYAYCNINPLEKVIEVYKEKDQVQKEKEELYERMIKLYQDVLEMKK